MSAKPYSKRAIIAKLLRIQDRLMQIGIDWANFGVNEQPVNEQKRLQAVKANHSPALKTLRWNMAGWGLYPAKGSLP